MGRVAALLLAAGESSRMGGPKALLPWRGTTLLNYQVSTLRQAGLSPIIVVLGHGAQELEPHLKGAPGVKLVFNPRYRRGKTTSIKAGLEVLCASEMEAILVLNVDQPRTLETIAAIVGEHRRNAPLITIPTYRGKSGHPVVFSVALLEELMEISEDTQGLKAVTHGHKEDTRHVEIDSSEVLLDLNTEEDYRCALEEYGAV